MSDHRAHAILSASGSGKWLVCTPSARAEEHLPDEGSVFSAEGTLAHEIFDTMIRLYLGLPVEKQLADFEAPEGMLYYVSEAYERAVQMIEQARQRYPDPVILPEQKLDFSRWVPEGFGRGDLVIITDDLVEVADFKYGKGVLVEAKGNSQMRLYALGAYNELSHLYDIKRVRAHVLQPRVSNWSSEELTIEQLLSWADNTVVPKAAMAWAGDGERVAGDHCSDYFCRARYTCAARNEAAQELVEIAFSILPAQELTMEQMSKVLLRADEVIKWLNDAKDWALKQAEKGNKVPGFKLVEGRSNRRYCSEEQIAQVLQENGFSQEQIYQRSLLGITAMEQLLGKKKFAEILGTLIEKPQGKPTLVPESDKRPAIDVLSYFTDESQEDRA